MVPPETTTRDKPALYSIHPSLSFVDALADGVLAKYGQTPASLSKVRILVPTRRSARTLMEAFVRQNEGAAMLLPRISPIGDIDEDEETFAEATQFLAAEVEAKDATPPAIGNTERHFMLSALILKAGKGDSFEVANEGQALQLAYELAELLDQVQREGLTFDGLADLVPDRYAAHWQETLKFLAIITEHWPAMLKEKGLVDPMDRRNDLMRSLARHWEITRPADPIIIAGSTGSIPATARLMKVVSQLPEGAIVLPGLDLHMTDAAWDAIDVSHPQWGMRNLLQSIEADRHEVEPWPMAAMAAMAAAARVESDRVETLSEAMTPVEMTGGWVTGHSASELTDVHLLDAPAIREEAGAIALMMREVAESPDKSCALVTPDRDLARRVGAELARWDIRVDDSAGKPLSLTPPGTLLRLVVRTVAEDYAPVTLLELMKHPLVAAGFERSTFLSATRRIEEKALRGPRRANGLDGLQAFLTDHQDLADVVGAVKAALAPLEAEFRKERTTLAGLLEAHVKSAEALSATHDKSGDEALWTGDAGEVAAKLLAEVLSTAQNFPELAPIAYSSVFLSLISRSVVRPLYGLHPQLFIWGPLEARLQSADRIILAGLNEGSWPQLPQASPWMSRDMQREFKLPVPERRIGLSAHDFVQATARGEVFLTRSMKTGGALSIPSRWLQRLEMYLKASGQKLERDQAETYLTWYTQLDQAEGEMPADRPRPRPPVAARPKRLSVTQIETLIRDPYAIYARHVLKLRLLAPIDEDPGAAERGTVIHKTLDEFCRRYPNTLPADPMAALTEVGREVFGDLVDNANVRAFWWPRFLRAGEWFLAYEADRRKIATIAGTEVKGEIEFPVGSELFKLTCTADRIDLKDSGAMDIIDYKTGKSPTDDQVTVGLSPQLPLEAAILKAGGFDGIKAGDIGDLIYVELKGTAEPGKERIIDTDANAIADEKLNGLKQLLHEFNDPETPYLSRVMPFSERFAGDYDHLARVAEQLGLALDE